MKMALNQEGFDTLINQLEILASKQPRIYRLRVAILATLGYTYIFLVLTVTLALLVGIILMMVNAKSFHRGAIQAIIFLFALVLVLLRSLWVSFPPPQGLVLQRKDVPGLFKLVDELSSKLKAPRFHNILLTDEFNAAVVQRPRLGVAAKICLCSRIFSKIE
jgi:ABC-type sugar transport system permease subunit